MSSRLQSLVDEFSSLPPELRVEALVDYAGRVPPLPARYAEHPELLERVEECQTPFFLATEVDDEDRVHLYFDCPPQAPTQRAFAGILAAALENAASDDVLALPDDLPQRMGLGEAISMLRLQGFHAIVARLKQQVRGTKAV